MRPVQYISLIDEEALKSVIFIIRAIKENPYFMITNEDLHCHGKEYIIHIFWFTTYKFFLRLATVFRHFVMNTAESQNQQNSVVLLRKPPVKHDRIFTPSQLIAH